jgi:RimJ/RimL family protein N-acetyltransferase
LEDAVDAGKDYLNKRCVQAGHVLPVNEKVFTEYFPPGRSFLILKDKRSEPQALFSFIPGSHKSTPAARFRLVADGKLALKQAVEKIEETAVAQERMILKTSVFGYDEQKLSALRELAYRDGASLPEVVSLGGRRYDWCFLYKDLTDRYDVPVARSYAKKGLYASVDVLKAKEPKLKIRGYRAEDRTALDKFASHPNVIRGIASGLFDGLSPWISGNYQEMVDQGRVFPLVCVDEGIGQPVGLLDLFRQPQDVLHSSMGLGMYVKPEYQGIGVGTMLMENMKTLAKRLHLARVWLTVFEGNTPAERLYKKAGFVECGRVPGWLQEGYINEIFMTLTID